MTGPHHCCDMWLCFRRVREHSISRLKAGVRRAGQGDPSGRTDAILLCGFHLVAGEKPTWAAPLSVMGRFGAGGR